MLRRFVLAFALVAYTGCSVGIKRATAPRVVASGRDPREIYTHGQKMLQRGAFDKAQADFQELRNFHRDDPVSVLAELSLADIHFRKGEYEEARFAYQEFGKYHPRHPAMDYVTFRTGLSVWKRAAKLAGRDDSYTVAAVRTWTGGGSPEIGFDWSAFERRYPDSEYAQEVATYVAKGRDRLAAGELWTARFYAKRNAWAAVQGRAEAVVRRYEDSRHEERALAMLARSLHAVGRVDDAEQARERLIADFPDSRFLAAVDRALARAPGIPPEDRVFVRPYRMPGLGEAPTGR